MSGNCGPLSEPLLQESAEDGEEESQATAFIGFGVPRLVG